MKAIVFTRQDGGVSVVHPDPRARLVDSVTLADGETRRFAPMPLYRAKQKWKGQAGVRFGYAETEERFLTRVSGRSVPRGADAAMVDMEALPQDRTFRDAWAREGKLVVHDMAKCRTIHMDRIRAARTEAFKPLDVEAQKALDRGDMEALKEIGTKRQTLRDIPQTLDLTKAKTPEDLKRLWPETLPRLTD